jgi:hypothetical protein
MRFNCEFEHLETGEHKTVPVVLTAEQVKSVEAAAGDAKLLAMAYALNRAYREVSRGFLHTEPPTPIQLS